MDNEQMDQLPEEELPYRPRPMWQVWLARFGLVLFLALVAMYYVNIARGGM